MVTDSILGSLSLYLLGTASTSLALPVELMARNASKTCEPAVLLPIQLPTRLLIRLRFQNREDLRVVAFLGHANFEGVRPFAVLTAVRKLAIDHLSSQLT
jgi:hypothetical protein